MSWVYSAVCLCLLILDLSLKFGISIRSIRARGLDDDDDDNNKNNDTFTPFSLPRTNKKYSLSRGYAIPLNNWFPFECEYCQRVCKLWSVFKLCSPHLNSLLRSSYISNKTRDKTILESFKIRKQAFKSSLNYHFCELVRWSKSFCWFTVHSVHEQYSKICKNSICRFCFVSRASDSW